MDERVVRVDISRPLTEAVLQAMTNADVIFVTAGALGRILEVVGPRILPEVTIGEWRLLATAAVAEGLQFQRNRAPDDSLPP